MFVVGHKVTRTQPWLARSGGLCSNSYSSTRRHRHAIRRKRPAPPTVEANRVVMSSLPPCRSGGHWRGPAHIQQFSCSPPLACRPPHSPMNMTPEQAWFTAQVGANLSGAKLALPYHKSPCVVPSVLSYTLSSTREDATAGCYSMLAQDTGRTHPVPNHATRALWRPLASSIQSSVTLLGTTAILVHHV